MPMRNIVLFGGGLHAKCVIDIVLKEKNYNIIGIVDSKLNIGDDVFGFRVIGRQCEIGQLVEQYEIYGGIIAIGDNWSRQIVYQDVLSFKPDFIFINAIHPSTIIGIDVTLGKGVVVMAGCVLNPSCRVGDFGFLATGAQLEHDSEMHEFSSISAGSITGGKVVIGRLSAIALGVTILDRITIGSNTVVGSGAIVTKNLPNNVLAYGAPAKIIRTRLQDERFLK
jgi:sugar O-acyltransferase (sialic acid O-acetyltransferase NeuD family)